jgi:hypothetical protein
VTTLADLANVARSMLTWRAMSPLAKVGVATVPLFAVSMLGVLTFGGWMVKDSGAYKHALSFCVAEPSLVSELGTPIDDGPVPTEHSGGDRATLTFSLHGPTGRGVVDIVTSWRSREWRVTYAAWTSSTGERRTLDPEK